jgi:hypothetical protein
MIEARKDIPALVGPINWANIDYSKYLDQATYWPSSQKQDLLTIETMPQPHALSAYHKLNSWRMERNNGYSVSLCPLQRALLFHAVGEPVTLNQDIPVDVDSVIVNPQFPSLEECYDILMALQDFTYNHDGGTGEAVEVRHIIAQARKLQELINTVSQGKEI